MVAVGVAVEAPKFWVHAHDRIRRRRNGFVDMPKY
jgi:hypothetical protein